MQAIIKKTKRNKFNIFIKHDGKEIPVGTRVREMLDKGVYETTEFETYNDAIKWINSSGGKFTLSEEVTNGTM